MPADVRLTAHFFLSQFTVCPDAARAGRRNEPLAHQVENLRRVAQVLELARGTMSGADIHILSAFRRSNEQFDTDAAAEGRAVDFIVPGFGTAREVCAHLAGMRVLSDRMVCAHDWVRIEVPRVGREPRRQLQTGVFEHGQPMRYLEGLV